MPVRADSRFAALPVMSVLAPDGSRRRVVALRLRTPALPVRETHRVAQGEGIDSIARRYCGDEGLWWRVLDANPVVFPLDVRVGDLVLVPDGAGATRAVRARGF